jgi:hypothetical protein
MECLEKDVGKVVISVIENFISDAVGDKETAENFNEIIDKTIKSYLVTVFEMSKRLPETKIALIKPLLRPKHEWYTNCYDEVCKHHEEGIKSMGVNNVTLIDSVTKMSQKFTSDGVHLTEEAGKNFVDSLLRASLTFFGAEFVDLETISNPMEVDVIIDPAPSTSAGSHHKSKERSLQQLNGDFIKRKYNDNIIFARIRDELDSISNKKRKIELSLLA